MSRSARSATVSREALVEEGFTAIKFGWGVFGEDAKRDDIKVLDHLNIRAAVQVLPPGIALARDDGETLALLSILHRRGISPATFAPVKGHEQVHTTDTKVKR